MRKYKSRSCPLIFFVTESKVAFLIDNFCYCYSGSVERPIIIAYQRTSASKHYYTNLTIIFFFCAFLCRKSLARLIFTIFVLKKILTESAGLEDYLHPSVTNLVFFVRFYMQKVMGATDIYNFCIF